MTALVVLAAWMSIGCVRMAPAGPSSVLAGVSALLTVDAAGHLVDFRSEDRSDVKANDRVERMPWTTPLSEFRRLDNGRSVPGRGDAVWHRADGPFVYGRFGVTAVTFDEAALR